MSTITIPETNIPVARSGITGAHVALFIISFFSIAIGGTVSTLMSVYLPVAVQDLLGSKNTEQLNSISAYINAVFIFGWAIGGFSWGVISDRVGRKKALLLAIAFYGLGTVLTGLAPNWEAVVICRFLSGFGVGGVLVVAFTTMTEVWPKSSRNIYIGILSIGIPVGIFSAGVINYVVSSWRQGFLVGIIPLSLAFLGIWLLNEQTSKTSHHERQGIGSLFSDDNRKKVLMGAVLFGTMLIGLWAIFSWLPTWIQSLIPGRDAAKERGLGMMLMGMGGLTGGFVSGWLANALTIRRAMMLCFTVCSGLSFILFKTNSTFSPIIYIEIGVLAFFFGVSQGVLSAYIPQLFPGSIRATATGFCFNAGRVVTATAVLFVGVLVAALGGYGNAIFIFSLVFIVGLLLVVFVKDTTRHNTV
ncbi:MFS transporter [Foetidibacter luteolus]|uniref:MFS transporter n=1 Tax=Foetidibacter luteolus TaxID=2608880 RepID=UPI00129A9EAD|nr:MFS transporter [Foetidibacter luteolus]